MTEQYLTIGHSKYHWSQSLVHIEISDFVVWFFAWEYSKSFGQAKNIKNSRKHDKTFSRFRILLTIPDSERKIAEKTIRESDHFSHNSLFFSCISFDLYGKKTENICFNTQKSSTLQCLQACWDQWSWKRWCILAFVHMHIHKKVEILNMNRYTHDIQII